MFSSSSLDLYIEYRGLQGLTEFNQSTNGYFNVLAFLAKGT